MSQIHFSDILGETGSDFKLTAQCSRHQLQRPLTNIAKHSEPQNPDINLADKLFVGGVFYRHNKETEVAIGNRQ